MTHIIPYLSPAFQSKLAQYALLAHRAAVLAALPAAPSSAKGRPVHWPTQPPAHQLHSVLHFMNQAASPKVGRVVLRAWFQKKTELRAAVHSALVEAGYLLPVLAEITEPSPWCVRLSNEDVRIEGSCRYCEPDGKPVPGVADASPEEVTLMSHLLGWSILSVQSGSTPPGFVELEAAALAHEFKHNLKGMLHRLAARMPPDLAEAVRRGELPADAQQYWNEGDWPQLHHATLELYKSLSSVLGELVPPPEVSMLEHIYSLASQLEAVAIDSFLLVHHRRRALAILARVEGLCHRQQLDFVPLATLRERTAAIRAAFDAQWPVGETGRCTVVITQDVCKPLLDKARVYKLLLRLVDHHDELQTLDETSEDFQKLEAATPPGVLNALLLGKLTPGA